MDVVVVVVVVILMGWIPTTNWNGMCFWNVDGTLGDSPISDAEEPANPQDNIFGKCTGHIAQFLY
jgi:hypothetical protein